MSQQQGEARQRCFFELILPESIRIALSESLRKRGVLFHQQPGSQLVEWALKLRQFLVLLFQLLNLLDVGGELFELGVLHEGLPHHFLHVDVLAVVQVQDDLVGHFELGDQMLAWIVHHSDHLFGIGQVIWILGDYDHVSLLVEASAARPA